MMHSSICTMDLRDLLNTNELIHLPVATPLLASSGRYEPKATLWFTTRRRGEQPYALSLPHGDDAVSIQGLPSQLYAILGHGMIRSNEKQCGEVSSLCMQGIVFFHWGTCLFKQL
jgi:hypothetical protein